jgi:hypothetical protein
MICFSRIWREKQPVNCISYFISIPYSDFKLLTGKIAPNTEGSPSKKIEQLTSENTRICDNSPRFQANNYLNSLKMYEWNTLQSLYHREDDESQIDKRKQPNGFY